MACYEQSQRTIHASNTHTGMCQDYCLAQVFVYDILGVTNSEVFKMYQLLQMVSSVQFKVRVFSVYATLISQVFLHLFYCATCFGPSTIFKHTYFP
jgi:hypothetical protein